MKVTIQGIVADDLCETETSSKYVEPKDLLDGFSDSVIFQTTEQETGFEFGLIVLNQDITRLAELMGDGESKESDADAITKIAEQYFVALSAAIETQFAKKLSLCFDVSQFTNTDRENYWRNICPCSWRYSHHESRC